ncbi:MAG: hypothetical protein GY930_12730 [bacterium]|nr:hypothetical protein [bacterium]
MKIEREQWVQTMESIHGIMSAVAEEHGLPTPKFETGKLNPTWCLWLSKNAKAIPAYFEVEQAMEMAFGENRGGVCYGHGKKYHC